ncbi:MAG TPA: biopolymer transporter ExbD [Candidatus Methylomirabilis sp.]|nr:biopolymer transporter ExbD [Candidatus Methylomirabilis sp.]
MGISLEGGKTGSIAEMNVVPLIDILLVLLIIFMVIAPQKQSGLPVDLPLPSTADPPAPPVVVVQVLKDGTLRINQEPAQWRDLQARLEAIFSMRSSRVAFVRGDGALEFGAVARAIDVMRASGIVTVGLMTPELEVAR